jgi:AcrR family transcriptional regulator
MARPKSADKRTAILDAAIAVLAERGVSSTPTSAISRKAGVAEGTLFTYFVTKDVLVNELYRTLKLELADAMLSTLPKSGTIKNRFRHVWNGYVQWGVAYPDKFKVMMQLRHSENISAESMAVGNLAFAELSRLAKASIRQKQIRNYPVEFIGAMFGGLAETAMAFVGQNPRARTDYCAAGFEVFWAGVASK